MNCSALILILRQRLGLIMTGSNGPAFGDKNFDKIILAIEIIRKVMFSPYPIIEDIFNRLNFCFC